MKYIIVLMFVILSLPINLLGFIVSWIIDTFQAGMDNYKSFMNWLVR